MSERRSALNMRCEQQQFSVVYMNVCVCVCVRARTRAWVRVCVCVQDSRSAACGESSGFESQTRSPPLGVSVSACRLWINSNWECDTLICGSVETTQDLCQTLCVAATDFLVRLLPVCLSRSASFVPQIHPNSWFSICATCIYACQRERKSRMSWRRKRMPASSLNSISCWAVCLLGLIPCPTCLSKCAYDYSGTDVLACVEWRPWAWPSAQQFQPVAATPQHNCWQSVPVLRVRKG